MGLARINLRKSRNAGFLSVPMLCHANGLFCPAILASTVAAMWELSQINIINSAINNYKWAIENGIAKEVARAILPEGNTVSRVYVNGNIRSWIHYIEVRRKNGTQKEHMMIARECARVISEIFPPIIKLQEKD